ncbi:MAG: hypothetical protein ACRCU1_08455 [Alsobacter sp.]
MARRNNEFLATESPYPYAHAALTATLSEELFKATRRIRVVSASYGNATGLAQSGSNSFAISLVKTGAVAVATGANTATTAIPAGGFTAMTLSTVNGAVVLEPGEILSFVATETGAATLPAGRLNVELAYV